jgi:hypothetical protein
MTASTAVPTLLLLPTAAASPHSVVARDGAAPHGKWGWGAAGGEEESLAGEEEREEE